MMERGSTLCCPRLLQRRLGKEQRTSQQQRRNKTWDLHGTQKARLRALNQLSRRTNCSQLRSSEERTARMRRMRWGDGRFPGGDRLILASDSRAPRSGAGMRSGTCVPRSPDSRHFVFCALTYGAEHTFIVFVVYFRHWAYCLCVYNYSIARRTNVTYETDHPAVVVKSDDNDHPKANHKRIRRQRQAVRINSSARSRHLWPCGVRVQICGLRINEKTHASASLPVRCVHSMLLHQTAKLEA